MKICGQSSQTVAAALVFDLGLVSLSGDLGNVYPLSGQLGNSTQGETDRVGFAYKGKGWSEFMGSRPTLWAGSS
jgi:hypothetical protein